MLAKRIGDGPLISIETPGYDRARLGDNINGPSLIPAPDWLPRRLGRYYLYFAQHNGDHIRLAVADRIEGPYRLHTDGALRLDQTLFTGHIASPDVHIDAARRRLIMYYHGCGGHRHLPGADAVEQPSDVAFSDDGLHWEPLGRVLGESYFRVFRVGGFDYAIAKAGSVYRSPAGAFDFEACGRLDLSIRHVAVLVRDGVAHLIYSRWGDQPERLLYAPFDVTGDPATWRITRRFRVLEPERPWEGACLAPCVSRLGAAIGVRQLRDPAFCTDEDGQLYLLYTAAGETSIALAKIDPSSVGEID